MKTGDMAYSLKTSEGITMKANGTITACVVQAFQAITATEKKTAAQMRELAMTLMKKEHDRLTADGR